MLHAAAWTDVDGAESDPQEAAAVNVGGTQHVAELGAPLVYFSTDYVFDGRKTEPYVESDGPNPLSVYGRTKLHGEAAAGEDAWIARSSWLFGSTGHNFVRTMLALGRERGRGRRRRRPARLPDVCRPSRSGGARAARTAVRGLARRGGRRLHVGGVRRGDLRRGGDRLPRPADHDGRARPAGAATRVLGAPQRAAQAPAPAALARGPPRLPRALAQVVFSQKPTSACCRLVKGSASSRSTARAAAFPRAEPSGRAQPARRSGTGSTPPRPRRGSSGARSAPDSRRRIRRSRCGVDPTSNGRNVSPYGSRCRSGMTTSIAKQPPGSRCAATFWKHATCAS